MDIQSEIKKIKELGSGYYFTKALQDLSDNISSGDDSSFQILEKMTDDCKLPNLWKENCRYCSAIVSALAHLRTSKSLQFLINFIQNLPEDMPYGAVDLLGSLLPVYENQIIGNLKEMAAQNSNASIKAVGMHALTNMALDDKLAENDMNFLLNLLEDFKGDRYFSSDFIEIAIFHIQRKVKNYENHEDLLDSILK